MGDNVKFCNTCNITKDNTILFDDNQIDFYAGYICCMKPEATKNMICPFCKNPLIEINITEDEVDLLGEISNYDRRFLESMISLKDTDIIEYNLKLSQFKTSLAQQENNIKTDNQPKCPTCGSTDLSKVSTISKAGSVALWGLFSQKVKKTWHCNNCKYEW